MNIIKCYNNTIIEVRLTCMKAIHYIVGKHAFLIILVIVMTSTYLFLLVSAYCLQEDGGGIDEQSGSKDGVNSVTVQVKICNLNFRT